MTNDTQLVEAWNDSYARRENHVFWPSDEVVRFISRHIRRRVSIREWVDIAPHAAGSRVLDAGCGIGRNLVFGHEMGLQMHGMDLSQHAIDHALRWLEHVGVPGASSRVMQADIRALPWPAAYFDHALSESALDSMPYSVAVEGIAEIARVLKPGGYFYCSLISGDETGHDPDFCGEVMVESKHEARTIQSYFNATKIRTFLEPHFEILSLYLVQTQLQTNSARHGRWHAVGRRCA